MTKPLVIHIPKKDGTSEVARDLVREIRRGYRTVDEDVKQMTADLWERHGVMQGNLDRQQLLEIERALTRYSPPLTAVYDAYVNPLLASDSPSTLTFKTPFAAIKYVADTLGKSAVAIGFRRPLIGPTQTATETGDYTGANSVTSVSMEVIGPDGRADARYTSSPDWDTGAFVDTAKFSRLSLRGLHVTMARTVNGPFQTASGATMFADTCFFNGSAGVTSGNAGPALSQGYFRDCIFRDISFNPTGDGSAGNYYWLRCALQSSLFVQMTFTKNMFTWDCGFFGRPANDSTLALTCQQFVAMDSEWSVNSEWIGTGSAVAGASWTITNASGPATQRIYITSGGVTASVNQGPVINFTGTTVDHLHLEGNYRKITVVAPAAVDTANGRAHYIQAHVEQLFDVTGPADLDVSAQQGACFLRGKGITGSVLVWGDPGSGTALSFIGVTNSVVQAALLANTNAPVAGKAYVIDAASANSVFIIETASLFPGASTNASGTCLVIDHNGTPPTGVAGGSLAGAYPNPTFAGRDASVDAINKDLLPSLLTDVNGMTVIPTPPFSGAPSGPAGGSLAGTYPNPSFAGRDSSVDKLNQDMLPAWLGGEPLPGITAIPATTSGGAPSGPAGGSLAGTYPNPSFSGRDASVDAINKDLLPSLLTDVNGVVTIPATNGGGAPSGPAGGSLAGTYPNPSFAGRDSSVDKLNQDLLPSLFAPQEGVVRYGNNPGPYGDASTVPVFSLDQNGNVILAFTTSILIPEVAVIGLVADLAARPTRGQVAALITGSFVP